jgi:hypothetical protein
MGDLVIDDSKRLRVARQHGLSERSISDGQITSFSQGAIDRNGLVYRYKSIFRHGNRDRIDSVSRLDNDGSATVHFGDSIRAGVRKPLKVVIKVWQVGKR